MNIGKSLSFVFEDKKWIEKVLIGGVLMLIPLLGPILLMGYGVQLVRNVRNHDPEPLPAWDDWGTKIGEGLKLIIITIIWALPLYVLMFLMFIPAAMNGNSDTGSAFASFLSLCFSCFTFLYAIVLWLAVPGIIIKFAETGEFGDGFKFGEIMDFTKKNLGSIILVAIVSWLVYMVAGLIGSLLCLVGLLFTMFWASLVYYHMVAQIGLEEAPARPMETVTPPAEPAAKLPEEATAEAPAEELPAEGTDQAPDEGAQ
jgi:hypothetical protein